MQNLFEIKEIFYFLKILTGKLVYNVANIENKY